MKIKQRPEDFVVREGYRFEDVADGPVWVYRMDKQKVSTLQALERLGKEFNVRRRDLSVCGLKDKQGRTEQLVGVNGGPLGQGEVIQAGDLRLKLIGRIAEPLSSDNITANRFEVTVRDLSREEAERVPESVAEVEKVGVVNYFDSQRFGFLKHGQGLIGKDLLKGDFESVLRRFLAMPSELDKSDDARVKRFWQQNWGQWQQRAPGEAAARYAPMLRQLRADPKDFKGAFMHIDRRVRMMMLFELQSLIWNEGVKRYIARKVPPAELIGLRYQAGSLTFPRALPREIRDTLLGKTFPLLAPDSKIDDPEIRSAALEALATQSIRLEHLVVPGTPMFFKHEERPIFVRPGKLRVNEPRLDELNGRRLKLNLSFTLPPGAYASLVVRRVLWYAAEGQKGIRVPGRAEPRDRDDVPKSPPVVDLDRDEDDDDLETDAPAGKAGGKWGQPAEGPAKRHPSAAAKKPRWVERVKAGAPLEPEKPATPKKGFREKQRERKVAKATHRATVAAKRAENPRPAKKTEKQKPAAKATPAEKAKKS